jgi:hypothetical protein
VEGSEVFERRELDHSAPVTPENLGVRAALLLRVWFEDGDPPRLRIRSIPLAPHSGRGSAWTTAEDAINAVREWLTDLINVEERQDGDC